MSASMIPEVYMMNVRGYERSRIGTCHHRRWFQWWRKPHYRTVRKSRLSVTSNASTKENPVEKSRNEATTMISTPGRALQASTTALSGSHDSILDSNCQDNRFMRVPGQRCRLAGNGDTDVLPASTVLLSSTPPPARRVRIASQTEQILNTSSAESGIDSTFTSTPSRTRRLSDLSTDEHNIELDGSDDNRSSCVRKRLPFEREKADFAHHEPTRDSFVSVEYQSAASSLSDGYAPSVVTTESMKSVYFSVSSDKDSRILVWQPEGEVWN